MNDWLEIASAVADEYASEEQKKLLESWLCEEPSNADEYTLWAEIHEALHTHFQEENITKNAGTKSVVLPLNSFRAKLAQHPFSAFSTWTATVAACLLLALWGAGLLNLDTKNLMVAEVDKQESTSLIEPEAEEIAATLTGAIDCRWSQDGNPFSYGQHLVSGTILKIEEGLIQVTYESGAKVVVRGPSEFHLEGPSKGILPVGQITAVVPRRAAGFVVQTPCAEVIDLGTEFAVDVAETGVSEVHVFKGEVVSRRRNEGENPTTGDLHLLTHEAARYSPDDVSVSEFKADDRRFIREINPRLTASELPQAPQIKGLSLWMAADLLVETDIDNRVVAWRDILCGDNQVPDDALQSEASDRPQLVTNVDGSYDALRFDGLNSHLVTTPMETGPSQTILLVAKTANQQPKYFTGSILSYNGPPHRDMTSLAKRGVMQIGLGGDINGKRSLEAFVYVGASARAGGVHSHDLPPETTFVGSYVYNMEQNDASLYINGDLVSKTSAPAPATGTSRKVIGRHGHLDTFFCGDIAEVIVYDRAIKTKELKAVTNYLKSKYEIPRTEYVN